MKISHFKKSVWTKKVMPPAPLKKKIIGKKRENKRKKSQKTNQIKKDAVQKVCVFTAPKYTKNYVL